MGALPGNKNGRGAKGRSGRKSAYAERANAEFLAEFFFKQHSREEIRKMVSTGKYSVSEVMLTKAYAGDMKAILAVFHKLFPDTVNVQGGIEFDFTQPK